jgi:hypothetical protein
MAGLRNVVFAAWALFLLSLCLPSVELFGKPIPGWFACICCYPFYLGNLILIFSPFLCRMMKGSVPSRPKTLITFGVLELLHAGWCLVLSTEGGLYVGFYIWWLSYVVLAVALIAAGSIRVPISDSKSTATQLRG